MFNRLRNLISGLAGGEGAVARFAEDDHRLAAAALLVHANRIDGRESAAETSHLSSLLMERFSLDASETKALIVAAGRRDLETTDLQSFTAVLCRAYGPQERRQLLAMMWELIFADGVVHDFEDAMVWRVAGLLDVTEEERDAIRKDVAKTRGLVFEGGL